MKPPTRHRSERKTSVASALYCAMRFWNWQGLLNYISIHGKSMQCQTTKCRSKTGGQYIYIYIHIIYILYIYTYYTIYIYYILYIYTIYIYTIYILYIYYIYTLYIYIYIQYLYTYIYIYNIYTIYIYTIHIYIYTILAPSYPNSENVHILWIHRTPDLSLWTHCFPNLFPCVWHVSHLWIDWLRWEDLSAQFGNCLAPCRCLVLFLKCYGAWMN